MDINYALELFGLSSKEIKVYLALLDLGESTAQQIAKKTGILRQTVYDLIDGLKQKGLVSETLISNVNHYSAANPEELNKIEDGRQKAIRELVPELKKRASSKFAPQVQAFFGIKGIEKVYNDTLDSKEIYWIEPYAISREVIKEFKLENYIKRRIEKKVKIRVISDVYNEEQRKRYLSNPKELRETKFNDLIKDWESGMAIYGDKVAIYSVKNNLIGIIIQSEQIAKTFLRIFDLLWEQGSRNK